jgi:hypothetical protein
VRPSVLFVHVLSKRGKVEQLLLTYDVAWQPPSEGAYGVQVAKVGTEYCDVPFKLLRPSGTGKPPAWRIVTTPASTKQQVDAAFDLNFSCLATKNGCMAPRDLLSPAIATMDDSGGDPSNLCIEESVAQPHRW